MNIAAQPPVQADQTIYLKDYQKPSFLVESINLDIQVYDDKTIVDSTLVMKRQTAGDLVLLGRDLELQSIQLNGQDLTPAQYSLDSEQLVITDAPDEVILQTQVIIHPETNTQLEGLYKADELFVTQNEPEGFRKITFYPDRPDVLSVFTTRVEADKNTQYYLLMVTCLKQVKRVKTVTLQSGKTQLKSQAICSLVLLVI